MEWNECVKQINRAAKEHDDAWTKARTQLLGTRDKRTQAADECRWAAAQLLRIAVIIEDWEQPRGVAVPSLAGDRPDGRS